MSLTRYPSGLFTSNVYLFKASHRDALLFDIGELEGVIDDLNGSAVKALFLTHCHYDHIYFINELVDLFPEVEIFGHRITLQALADPKVNLSFYHESPVSYTGQNLFPLSEPQRQGVLDFGSTTVSWFWTPGHHPGAVSFKIGRYLVTGDSFIPGIPVVTKLKGGDKAEATRSKKLIVDKMKQENLVIAPGHGQEMKMEDALLSEAKQQNNAIPSKRAWKSGSGK